MSVKKRHAIINNSHSTQNAALILSRKKGEGVALKNI